MENQKPKVPQENSTPQTTKTIHNPSNVYYFDECIAYMNKRGKEMFGKHFSVHAGDYEIIYKLLVYIINDEQSCEKYNISLKKGILLSGPVGTGKTSLMTLLNYFQQPGNRYVMKSCRDLSFEFIQDGYQVIHKYTKNSFNGVVPRVYCFDDLGTENNLKYYGNECNVMAEVLLSRYDLFVSKKMLTHITTNLTAQEIENLYGNRLRSRMREMFNLIAFEPSAKDKRS